MDRKGDKKTGEGGERDENRTVGSGGELCKEKTDKEESTDGRDS